MARKWLFEADFPFGKLESAFVKIDARPHAKVDESSTNLNWSDIAVTYLDVKENTSVKLCEVLRKFNDLENSELVKLAENLSDLYGTGKLTLLLPEHKPTLGLGLASNLMPTEVWTLDKLYPSSVTFDCDYDGSNVTIDVTWRYQNARCTYLLDK